MSKIAPLLAILLLLSFDAGAQFFNPVVPGPYKGPFGTAGPLLFTNQNAAASYDNGGQGLGYNVPSPGCTGAACAGGSLSYRPDPINFKASTFGPGFNYELSYSVSPVSYNYTASFSQSGPYIITLWVGSASAGGSWNVYIDKQLVGTVATPSTGSYTLLTPAASSPFNATIGTHVLTLAWGSGDASGNAGDIVAWQGSVVTSGSQFDVARNTGTNFSFSADHLTATALTNAPTNSDFSAFVTRQQSDVKRFFRFTVGTKSSGCGQGVGVATGTEINGAYLGHGGANSVGIFADGSTSLNNGSIGSTGITFASGDVIDLIIDPTAKTIQEVKNGGAPSAPLNIAGLSTQNVSPAISLCAINDSVVYSGSPPVSYSGAVAWDAPPPTPAISGITVSPGVFHTPSTNPVETLTANCSIGSCTGATFSLPSTATAGCTTAQIAQNGLFTISGKSLNAVSTINGTPTENVGIVATLAGATGSGTCYPFTLTGNSAVGVACGIGPTYNGSVPAPAALAGLTTCAANYDFSDPSYATLTNWLDCTTYGTAAGGQYQWHIGIGGFPSWGQCGQFAMVNDSSIGKTVLKIEYPQGTQSIESMSTQGNLGTGPLEFGFPYVYYIETTYKIVQLCPNCPQNAGGPNGLFVWNNNNGNGLLEDDLGELYTDQGGFGDKGWVNWTGGGGCNQAGCVFLPSGSFYPAGWSPTSYFTYSTMVTNNGSQAYWCTYVNTTLMGGNCPGMPSPNLHAMLGQTDNTLILQTQGNSGSNNVSYDLLVQYIRIWECPGFVSNSSKCLTQPNTSSGPNGETFYHQ